MSDKPKPGDLRVWWIPQIPGKYFHAPIATPAEAKKLLSVLADYDLFQLTNRITPDYTNDGGLEVFEVNEGDPGEWIEWFDENTNEDIGNWEPQP